jgi:serine/threonine protein kinase
MGEIFLAKHGLAGFEKLAVIKKVLPHLAADAQFISRFVDEAQVAIKLQHVNVAQVFEVGRVGDEYFLALEYIEGRDLRRTLAYLGNRKQRLPVDLALFIGREMANGLAYAHRRTSNDGSSLNLVHCDISPPNILVSFEGETKVIDFGIAKSAIRGTATDPKMGFGKFGYMAPEQLIRGGVVDHRTDLYAAGVVLFELLTGQRLYEAGAEPDYRALAKKVAKGEHTFPSEVDKSLAPYDDLVATALRPKPEDRYQTAAEFRDAIQQALVAVNPTISTDVLGAYMRDLFAPEMTAQRELHERVAKAHLEDFQDELTKETGTTVSFAMANLPLSAPADGAPMPATSRRSGAQKAVRPRSPTRPQPAIDPAAPPAMPTASIPTTELALADGTGAVEPSALDSSLPPPAPKRRTALVLAILAGAAVLAVVIVLLAQSKKDPPAKVSVATPPAPQIRVESIPPEEQTPTVEPIIEATDPVVEPVVEPKKDSHKKRHGDKKVEPKVEPKAELSKDAVIAKYRAARSAYEAYKAANGGRFDQEWNDLTSYVQYHPNELEELARRIESFRGKLRE